MVDPTMTRPRPVSVPAESPWELPSPYGAHPYDFGHLPINTQTNDHVRDCHKSLIRTQPLRKGFHCFVERCVIDKTQLPIRTESHGDMGESNFTQPI